jgi:cytochrome c biogenesis protein CcdA
VGDLARIRTGKVAGSAEKPAVAALAALIGAVLTLFAVTVGAILLVVFAATLAVVVLLASLLLGLAALTFRPRRTRASVQIRAQGGGTSVASPAHAWIAYQWDQPRS